MFLALKKDHFFLLGYANSHMYLLTMVCRFMKNYVGSNSKQVSFVSKNYFGKMKKVIYNTISTNFLFFEN